LAGAGFAVRFPGGGPARVAGGFARHSPGLTARRDFLFIGRLRHADNILLADDPDVMAHQIVRLSFDTALWLPLSSNGYEAFRNEFSEASGAAKGSLPSSMAFLSRKGIERNLTCAACSASARPAVSMRSILHVGFQSTAAVRRGPATTVLGSN
jgi:hypothetical protein